MRSRQGCFQQQDAMQVLYVEPDMMNKLHSVLDPATLEEIRSLAEDQVCTETLLTGWHDSDIC